MKNDEKAVIVGASAILAYFFLEGNKEKKMNISEVSISPPVFYA